MTEIIIDYEELGKSVAKHLLNQGDSGSVIEKTVAKAIKSKLRAYQSLNELPMTGESRWYQIEKLIPFSKETFRKLSNDGKAPRRIQRSTRFTVYENAELHKFLSNTESYVYESKSS